MEPGDDGKLSTVKESFGPDSLLHAFSEDEVEAVFASGTERKCAEGENIVTEGEPGETMFFLLEGRADVILPDGKRVRTYGAGGHFGELSWINPGQPRSTSIIATAPSRLLVLEQESIQKLLDNHPNVIFTLLRRTTAFLVGAERQLIGNLQRRNAELEETIKKLDFTRRQLTKEEEAGRRDAMTGLFNRRCFDAELPNFMERAGAIGSGLALVAMDLDHFKPVNDTLGHAAGDEVLRGVGAILRQKLRDKDLPCRVGGDEFILLIADITDEVARQRAEDVRAAIGEMPHPGNDRGIRCTGTLGGTMYRPGETAEEFMHRADETLYAAKRAGRNRVGWES